MPDIVLVTQRDKIAGGSRDGLLEVAGDAKRNGVTQHGEIEHLVGVFG